MLTRQQFLHDLRAALNYLHDPSRLPKSPVAALFGVADRPDTFSALQRILIAAIEALEPGADESPQSHAWRIYDALFYRYVEGFSPRQVADQLGIGLRHVRREQRAALEALAHRLWHQFGLEAESRQEADAELAPTQTAESTLAPHGELAWLKECPPQTRADLNQVLFDVLDLARVLAAKYQVDLKCTIPDVLPTISAHPVALNQTLLSLLGVATHRALGGQVQLLAELASNKVEIQITAERATFGSHPTSNSDSASLDMADQLAALCGGRLTLSDDGESFVATVAFPLQEQLLVLVIDDNADTLQLLERYTLETRYRLIGTRDPAEALSLAEKHSPRIIVLDVMMPQVDGWKVLGLLRQHPLTSHIPIVLCTILAQEDLGLSLGASAFIRKPVSRQTFLDTLNDQAALTETALR